MTTVSDKEEKLSALSKKVERSDQAKNDLRGLEETGKFDIFYFECKNTFLVGRELQTLHSLRRMFVNDLRARVRRAQVGFNSIRRLCPQLGISHVFVFTQNFVSKNKSNFH